MSGQTKLKLVEHGRSNFSRRETAWVSKNKPSKHLQKHSNQKNRPEAIPRKQAKLGQSFLYRFFQPTGQRIDPLLAAKETASEPKSSCTEDAWLKMHHLRLPYQRNPWKVFTAKRHPKKTFLKLTDSWSNMRKPSATPFRGHETLKTWCASVIPSFKEQEAALEAWQNKN